MPLVKYVKEYRKLSRKNKNQLLSLHLEITLINNLGVFPPNLFSIQISRNSSILKKQD